uniref:Uncharacterized protein n=1 Tax=Triticum urartu TaxID=4572 RepID=A0A8R7P9T8_TRIUA
MNHVVAAGSVSMQPDSPAICRKVPPPPNCAAAGMTLLPPPTAWGWDEEEALGGPRNMVATRCCCSFQWRSWLMKLSDSMDDAMALLAAPFPAPPDPLVAWRAAPPPLVSPEDQSPNGTYWPTTAGEWSTGSMPTTPRKSPPPPGNPPTPILAACWSWSAAPSAGVVRERPREAEEAERERLFLRQPPPTGTLRSAPPLVQYRRQALQKWRGCDRL